jgi:hypothetical protein
MRKAATIAEKRPVFRRYRYDVRIGSRIELTNTKKPFASSLQASVMTLSYSAASFIYVYHIVFVESSWAVLRGS